MAGAMLVSGSANIVKLTYISHISFSTLLVGGLNPIEKYE